MSKRVIMIDTPENRMRLLAQCAATADPPPTKEPPMTETMPERIYATYGEDEVGIWADYCPDPLHFTTYVRADLARPAPAEGAVRKGYDRSADECERHAAWCLEEPRKDDYGFKVAAGCLEASARNIRHMRDAAIAALASPEDATPAAPVSVEEADAIRADRDRLREGIEAIRQYGSDTLSGPSDRADNTREWQRDSVKEMVRRASLLLKGYDWDAKDEGDTPTSRRALAQQDNDG